MGLPLRNRASCLRLQRFQQKVLFCHKFAASGQRCAVLDSGGAAPYAPKKEAGELFWNRHKVSMVACLLHLCSSDGSSSVDEGVTGRKKITAPE